MQAATKNKLEELKAIITKLPLELCCVWVVPELGVQWKEVSRAVRNARLPMTGSSVSRVLCRHAANTLPQEELDDVVSRLRLKLVATQPRTWHVIRLLDPTTEEPVSELIRNLPSRVLQALRRGKNVGMAPEVQTVTLGDLIYLSAGAGPAGRGPLYVATPPGQPVALVSSVGRSGLLKGCVEALGYASFEDAELRGRDAHSLLRISDSAWNANASHLASAPEYSPAPLVSAGGVDYTNRRYDDNYVNTILGADPPLLTELNVKSTRWFFDRSRLNKTLNLTVTLKSEDVANTLRSWVGKGALAPTSDFFHIFHKIKSNNITYNRQD